jgi:hypothetical protein
MELLLQIFLEFLVQVVGGVLLDLILHTISRVPRLSKRLNSLHTAFLFLSSVARLEASVNENNNRTVEDLRL